MKVILTVVLTFDQMFCPHDDRFAGYDTGACRQPPPVAYTLKLLIGAAPVAFIVTGLMILLLYPISEDVRLRNTLALENLRLQSV